MPNFKYQMTAFDSFIFSKNTSQIHCTQSLRQHAIFYRLLRCPLATLSNYRRDSLASLMLITAKFEFESYSE